MRLRAMLLAMVAVTASAMSARAATMYGSGSGQQGGRFGIVDQETADFTVLGDPTSGANEGLSGIAFDTDGRLWGSAQDNTDRESSRLIEIDPVTGMRIKTVDNIRDGSDENVRIVDLAVRPSTNQLFGIANGGVLYTINKMTAVATPIGNPIGNHGGIAFDRNGILYLVPINGGDLWQVNPDTGSTIGTALTLDGSGDCLDGLGARPSDGILFAAVCDGREIVRIDPITGEAEEIDPGDPEDDVADLAFRISERQTAPALSMVALGVLGGVLFLIGLRTSRRHKTA